MARDTIKDNELFAEFIGATLERATSGGRRLWSINNLPKFCKQIDIPESRVRVFYADDLEFNKSWDWLMPVVEKIEHDGHEIDIYKNACEIDMEEGMIREVAGSKIEATHKAVVEFIKWYNQQTKP